METTLLRRFMKQGNVLELGDLCPIATPSPHEDCVARQGMHATEDACRRQCCACRRASEITAPGQGLQGCRLMIADRDPLCDM